MGDLWTFMKKNEHEICRGPTDQREVIDRITRIQPIRLLVSSGNYQELTVNDQKMQFI